MVTATGVRIGWTDLPATVHESVAQILGSPVVESVSQPGGFSPGSADRVRTAAGTRAFVKAVSAAQNPVSPGLHRQEALVCAALPAHVPAPDLLGVHDDGEWVALVLEDCPGRMPQVPWTAGELGVVTDALAELAQAATPAPPVPVPPAAERLGELFLGWARLAEHDADHVRESGAFADPRRGDPWVAEHLSELVALAADAVTAMSGDTLVHNDVRADNVLLVADAEGGGKDGAEHAVLVDWAHACIGAPWLDTALFLVNPLLFGGHDPEALIGRLPVFDGVDPAAVTAVVAGATGYFLERSMDQPPVGLPTVRAFQRAQGEASLRWLQRRLGDRR